VSQSSKKPEKQAALNEARTEGDRRHRRQHPGSNTEKNGSHESFKSHRKESQKEFPLPSSGDTKHRKKVRLGKGQGKKNGRRLTSTPKKASLRRKTRHVHGEKKATVGAIRTIAILRHRVGGEEQLLVKRRWGATEKRAAAKGGKGTPIPTLGKRGRDRQVSEEKLGAKAQFDSARGCGRLRRPAHVRGRHHLGKRLLLLRTKNEKGFLGPSSVFKNPLRVKRGEEEGPILFQQESLMVH